MLCHCFGYFSEYCAFPSVDSSDELVAIAQSTTPSRYSLRLIFSFHIRFMANVGAPLGSLCQFCLRSFFGAEAVFKAVPIADAK